MSVKKYLVKTCDRKEVKNFIETWHYSKNINGLKSNYCFKLMDKDTMIGAMIYGQIAMANVWKKYVNSEDQLIELRRLCCIDDTPKNTESYFIGYTLRWLQKNTEIKKVISYADETYNHQGTIYKASNFKHIGMTNKGKVIVYNNKLYHDKTIRTKYKGKLKPYCKKIKDALDVGTAFYKDTLGKHIYTYNLRKPKDVF
tara:strand:+ start:497 stop:1093 length:597 start_codon:yes stop_codon:yes gene_type:complete